MEASRVHVVSGSTFSGLCHLLGLAMLYAKVSSDIYLSWWIVFLPSAVTLLHSIVTSIIFLFFAHTSLKQSNRERIDLRTTILWKATLLVISVAIFSFFVIVSSLLQQLDDAAIPEMVQLRYTPLFIPPLVCVSAYIVYSMLLSRLESTEEEQKGVSVSRAIANVALQLMSNSVTLCASGSCNSIYLSTLSSFFAAFGIPIAEYIHYFNFVAILFIGLQLLSLYSVQYTVKYPPFIVSVVGSVLILTDLFFSVHDYMTYVGNASLIASAIWNARLSKFSFSDARKRKAVFKEHSHLPQSKQL